MKTKLEIITSHKANREYPSFYHESAIDEMSDEYAREIVAHFETWKRENQRAGGDKEDEMRGKTPEQLFNLYLLKNQQ